MNVTLDKDWTGLTPSQIEKDQWKKETAAFDMTWVNLTQEIHHCFIIWWRQWSRYETILEGATPRHDAMQHKTSQLDALKLTQNTAQHNTTQHNTTENSKAQHKTMKFHTTQHTIINHNSSKHNTPPIWPNLLTDVTQFWEFVVPQRHIEWLWDRVLPSKQKGSCDAWQWGLRVEKQRK